jgi:hypothetical protein
MPFRAGLQCYAARAGRAGDRSSTSPSNSMACRRSPASRNRRSRPSSPSRLLWRADTNTAILPPRASRRCRARSNALRPRVVNDGESRRSTSSRVAPLATALPNWSSATARRPPTSAMTSISQGGLPRLARFQTTGGATCPCRPVGQGRALCRDKRPRGRGVSLSRAGQRPVAASRTCLFGLRGRTGRRPQTPRAVD